MLNIPEIDEMICRLLRPQDLAHCARVNKTWFKVAMPHLWQDFAWIQFSSYKNKGAFRSMVLEDYLFKLQDGDHARGDAPLRSLAFLPALTRYGSWVRELPEAKCLLQCFQPPFGSICEPTALDLMRHLYKHCPVVKVQLLDLSGDDLETDDSVFTIAEFVAPYARHVRFTSSWHRLLDTWKIKYLLDHCSSRLEELTFDVYFTFKEESRDEEQAQEEPKPWTHLKQLNLMNFNSKAALKTLGTWLWERCDKVERLRIDNICGVTKSFMDNISAHMRNLDEIQLGIETMPVSDTMVAMLLSGSHNGWKAVELKNIESFGSATRKALSSHFPTLERLLVDQTSGFTSHDMLQVLSSSPKLHTLVDLFINPRGRRGYRRLDAVTFVDQDPNTGLLNAWSCENTLKELCIIIRGIPRPDLEGYSETEGTCRGEGQEIQNRVFSRIARLTNLETLRLGNTRVFGFRPDIDEFQDDCLDMSLESGLWMLEGLKSLKELDVTHMRTMIGVEEVQWMVEHWPKLSIIRGLADVIYGGDAINWLREHHPEIIVET